MLNSSKRYLQEGIEKGDLGRLVRPQMTIDEFRSKMGEDKDIVVVGFTVFGKEPADDLVNFVEKSYDWVLDADVSSGETSDGNYMVFIEIERKSKVPEYIMSMLDDMMNLTDQSVKDWTFTYYKGDDRLPVTIENLTKKVIKSPEEYEMKTGDSLEEGYQLNSYRALAGVKVNATKIVDPQILAIQMSAGIK